MTLADSKVKGGGAVTAILATPLDQHALKITQKDGWLSCSLRLHSTARKSKFRRSLRQASVPRTDPYCGIGLRTETSRVHPSGCWLPVTGRRCCLSGRFSKHCQRIISQ